jgi:hypothetical protein
MKKYEREARKHVVGMRTREGGKERGFSVFEWRERTMLLIFFVSGGCGDVVQGAGSFPIVRDRVQTFVILLFVFFIISSFVENKILLPLSHLSLSVLSRGAYLFPKKKL